MRISSLIWMSVSPAPLSLPRRRYGGFQLHPCASANVLDTDLTNLFTWDTKQIFLYITASYPSTPSKPTTNLNTTTTTPTPPASTAIIWDAILPHPLSPVHQNQYIHPSPKKSSTSKSSKPSKSGKSSATGKKERHPGILKLAGQRPKYQITDPSGRLASRVNATLELHYNVQPWVGALTWGSPRAAETALVEQETGGLFGFVKLWRYFPVTGARTKRFNLPALKDRSDAAKSAGADGLGVASGGERNRGSPA